MCLMQAKWAPSIQKSWTEFVLCCATQIRRNNQVEGMKVMSEKTYFTLKSIAAVT